MQSFYEKITIAVQMAEQEGSSKKQGRTRRVEYQFHNYCPHSSSTQSSTAQRFLEVRRACESFPQLQLQARTNWDYDRGHQKEHIPYSGNSSSPSGSVISEISSPRQIQQQVKQEGFESDNFLRSTPSLHTSRDYSWGRIPMGYKATIDHQGGPSYPKHLQEADGSFYRRTDSEVREESMSGSLDRMRPYYQEVERNTMEWAIPCAPPEKSGSDEPNVLCLLNLQDGSYQILPSTSYFHNIATTAMLAKNVKLRQANFRRKQREGVCSCRLSHTLSKRNRQSGKITCLLCGRLGMSE